MLAERTLRDLGFHTKALALFFGSDMLCLLGWVCMWGGGGEVAFIIFNFFLQSDIEQKNAPLRRVQLMRFLKVNTSL